MMQIKSRTALAATALLALGTARAAGDLSTLPSGTYESDPLHSYLSFSYTHLGLSNPMLSFDDFTVSMDFEAAEPTNSKIIVTIDPASVVAGSETWHGHLTGPDFFDVANHPDIMFASDSIEAAGDGAYRVNGELTIKGVSKPVTLDVTINAAMNHPMSGDPVIGLSGSTEVLRSDFGLDKLVPAVSDEVTIDFTTELLGQQGADQDG